VVSRERVEGPAAFAVPIVCAGFSSPVSGSRDAGRTSWRMRFARRSSTTVRSYCLCQFSQIRADIPKYCCRRKVISASILRRSRTSAVTRDTGTWSAVASAPVERRSGLIRSSRRNSPGWIGGMRASDWRGMGMALRFIGCPQLPGPRYPYRLLLVRLFDSASVVSSSLEPLHPRAFFHLRNTPPGHHRPDAVRSHVFEEIEEFVRWVRHIVQVEVLQPSGRCEARRRQFLPHPTDSISVKPPRKRLQVPNAGLRALGRDLNPGECSRCQPSKYKRKGRKHEPPRSECQIAFVDHPTWEQQVRYHVQSPPGSRPSRPRPVPPARKYPARSAASSTQTRWPASRCQTRPDS
jgi:hypothetical protein